MNAYIHNYETSAMRPVLSVCRISKVSEALEMNDLDSPCHTDAETHSGKLRNWPRTLGSCVHFGSGRSLSLPDHGVVPEFGTWNKVSSKRGPCHGPAASGIISPASRYHENRGSALKPGHTYSNVHWCMVNPPSKKSVFLS